jgi:L-fuculose-phosphate aldolase
MPDRRPLAYACEDEAREALTAADESVNGTGGAGCLSLRWRRSGGAGFLVTRRSPRASAAPLIEWLPLQDRDAGSAAAALTEEWRLHRDIYLRRGDLEAIIGSRPVFGTALACSARGRREGLPAFHPDVDLVAGGPVPCIVLAALAGASASAFDPQPVLAALEGRPACLLADRGLLVCAGSLPRATALSTEIEALARIYWHVLQLPPDPHGA